MGKKVSELAPLAVGDVAEAADLLAVFDTGANILKKISVEDFLTLVPGLDINGLPAISFADIDALDELPIYDIAAAANKKVTVQFLFDYVTKNLDDAATIASGDIVQASDFIFIYDTSLGNVVKLSVADFLTLAGGGGLTFFTESTGTNDFGSKKFNALTVTGATASIDAVISPKGAGAFRTGVGGDDRGTYAIDLQTNTSAGAAAVAAAVSSCITHGYGNTVKLGADYGRAGGRYAVVRRFGEDVWAAASSANTSDYGDQMSKMVLFDTITGITAAELSANSNSTKRIEMAGTNSLIRVVIDLVATCTSPGNGTTVLTEVYSTSKAVVIHISAGVSTIIGTTTYGTAISQASMADSDLTFDIDAGTQDLKVLFTPPTTAGTTTAIRVLASAHITELYGH